MPLERKTNKCECESEYVLTPKLQYAACLRVLTRQVSTTAPTRLLLGQTECMPRRARVRVWCTIRSLYDRDTGFGTRRRRTDARGPGEESRTRRTRCFHSLCHNQDPRQNNSQTARNLHRSVRLKRREARQAIDRSVATAATFTNDKLTADGKKGRLYLLMEAPRSLSDLPIDSSGVRLPAAYSPAHFPTVAMAEPMGGDEVPPATQSVGEAEAPVVLYTPQEADQRPWDGLGPPADPCTFERPRFDRGRRDQVLCYIPATQSYERLDRVLFRDEPMSGVVRRQGGRCIESAYYPVPHKKPIHTIMGHVEICCVLQRSRLGGDDDEDDEDSRGSEDDYGEDDDDDEVCFELTDRLVAVKVNFDSKMRELRNRHAEDPLKEIAAMQLVGDANPHVLGCSEVLYDPGNQTLNIVMRFCRSGDLFQRLQESQASADDGPPGLPEGQARYWFRQIMRGVKALHAQGICHRDLSPENIMLDEDESIIIDLGMCLRVPYLETEQQRRCLIKPQGACGKLPYMSPEIYRNRSPFDGAAADVWTTGTILFCMLTGNRSYQRAHASDPQFYWMTRDLNQLLTDWQIQVSPEGFHLLQNILQVNPRLRLTIDEVLAHPWFRFPDERPVAPMEF